MAQSLQFLIDRAKSHLCRTDRKLRLQRCRRRTLWHCLEARTSSMAAPQVVVVRLPLTKAGSMKLRVVG